MLILDVQCTKKILYQCVDCFVFGSSWVEFLSWWPVILKFFVAFLTLPMQKWGSTLKQAMTNSFHILSNHPHILC
jgi:hypothetical protein